MRFGHFMISSVSALVLLSGCSTLKMKPEGRSAADQLLVAEAVRTSINQIKLKNYIEGKKVFFTVAGHSKEFDYIQSVAPAYLMMNGAILAATPEEADLNLGFVVDVAGSDEGKGGWGIPIILPSLTAGFSITTIDFVETQEQEGISRIWVYATDRNGDLAFTSNPSFARYWVKNLTILGISFGKTSNVKDLKQRIPLIDMDVPILE